MTIYAQHNRLRTGVGLSNKKFFPEQGNRVLADRHRADKWSIEDQTIHVYNSDSPRGATMFHDYWSDRPRDGTDRGDVGESRVNRAVNRYSILSPDGEPLASYSEGNQSENEEEACALLVPLSNPV